MNIVQKYLLPPRVEVVHYDQNGEVFVIKDQSDLDKYKEIFYWVDKNYICQLQNYLQGLTEWGRKSCIQIFDKTKKIVVGQVNVVEESKLPVNNIF